MKISCEVIKDLLPLYQDGICSDESKKIIEEHIQNCEECKTILKNIGKELKIETISNEELDLKNLSKKWNKKIMWSMLKGALSAFVVGAFIFMIIYIFIGIKIG